MADTVFFSNRATLKVVGTSASPASVTIAVVKGIEISVDAEHVGLWGYGSIKRQAVAKHTLKVQIKISFAKFSPVVASPWWAWYILAPTAGTLTTGVEDTNTVKTFTVNGTFTGSDGTVLDLEVIEVYFPKFPWKSGEGKWIQIDLDGEGSDVIPTNAAPS